MRYKLQYTGILQHFVLFFYISIHVQYQQDGSDSTYTYKQTFKNGGFKMLT
jgi:hypothetical protein